jgi:hypothetical protein
MTVKYCLAIVCVALSACTTTIRTTPTETFEPDAGLLQIDTRGLAWWQLRFKLDWPADEAPDFSGHLLVAEQIVLPILLEHEERFRLWRFHRRAGRDNSGNQFSLIFLSDPDTAARIDAGIRENPLASWLKDRSYITRISLDQRGAGELAELEETSDKEWPEEIQRSWPWFIMGASQAWMMQVQEISREKGLPGTTAYPGLLDHYRDVASSMNNQWRNYGQHAYFHHISALYGYQPLRIRSTELKTF